MCSLEKSDLHNVNSSISDDHDNIHDHKLEKGKMFESKSSQESLLPFLSSPLDSRTLKDTSDKKISSIENDDTELGTSSLLVDKIQDQYSIHTDENSQVQCDIDSSPKRQQNIHRNSELIRHHSPGRSRVKDSISLNTIHLSNFLVADCENNVSQSSSSASVSSSSIPSADRSLDLTDVFHSESQSPKLHASMTTCPNNNNTASVHVSQNNNHDNPTKINTNQSIMEKNLTFGKIRIRTHQVTESERHLDWHHNNNSESFVLDEYEKQTLEQKKAQRRRNSKHKNITKSDTVITTNLEPLTETNTKQDHAEAHQQQQPQQLRVGSLSVLEPQRYESNEEDTTSLPSGRSDKSSSSRLSFGDVRVRRHDQTLGDHPCVSQGPPVALDWAYLSSQHFDLDEYETLVGDRQKAQKLSPEEREELLRTKGVSDDSLSRMDLEVQQIKASREAVKNDKKKEEDIMIYKLLSSATWREARLSSRRAVVSAEKTQDTKLRQNSKSKRLSEPRNKTTQNAINTEADPGLKSSSQDVSAKLSQQRWHMSLKNLFLKKKL